MPNSLNSYPDKKNYALVGGAIFDAHTGTLRENQAVQIEANRIFAVCEPAALPENMTKIDISGRAILPGLIVEPGKLADLVIVEGNPTVDIQALQRIEAVIRNGRWFDPDALLAQAAEYAKNAEAPQERRFDADY